MTMRAIVLGLATVAVAVVVVVLVVSEDRSDDAVELSAVAKEGCKPRRADVWIGYTTVAGGRRLRIGLSGSSSREPCGLRLSGEELTVYTHDPAAAFGDLKPYCVEAVLPQRNTLPESLTDPTTGTSHSKGAVDAPEDPARDFAEAAARDALRGELPCRLLRPGLLDSDS